MELTVATEGSADTDVARYLSQFDTADPQGPSEALAAKTAHLKEKLAKPAARRPRGRSRGGRSRRQCRRSGI
jgi:hypothetical protein